MTSAYETPSDRSDSLGDEYVKNFAYLPWQEDLPNGRKVSISALTSEQDVEKVKHLLNEVIKEGMSWPFEEPLSDSAFRNYFLAHTALVARSEDGEVIGAFYCKPNFPGRCSHYCNGGFITDPRFRRQGIAYLMGKVFLRIARDLGFHSVLFNLVFTSNIASIKLWDSLGFTRLALLPKVGRLRVGEYDAVQYYYDLQRTANGTFQAQKVLSQLRSKVPRMIMFVVLFVAGRYSRRCARS